MANVSVGVNPIPSVNLWKVPNDVGLTYQPRGEVVFQESAHAIIAKAMSDEQSVTLTLTLPHNYVYQLQECFVSFLVTGEAQLIDIAPVLQCRQSDATAVQQRWWMTAEGFVDGNSSANLSRAFASNFTSVTLDETGVFLPRNLPRSFIGPGGTFGNGVDQSGALINWVDVTSDATATYSVDFYFRYLMYTVDQVNAWPIHATGNVLVVGS